MRCSTWNSGLDFGLFNNRISGAIEVYKAFTATWLLPEETFRFHLRYRTQYLL